MEITSRIQTEIFIKDWLRGILSLQENYI